MTAWFMRMRVCEVMSYRTGNLRMGTFHVDETCVVESFSGNHTRSTWFFMPREAHRNGQDSRVKNYSKSSKRACIVCGVNEFGDSFALLSNDGSPAKSDISLVLSDVLPKGSTFVTDGHKSYPNDMKDAFRKEIDLKDPLSGNIAMVNSLHSLHKSFLRLFRGVSVRRLQRYLDWFCYRDQYKRSYADRRGLLFHHGITGRYVYTRKLTFLEEHPYQPYCFRRFIRELTSHMSILV